MILIDEDGILDVIKLIGGEEAVRIAKSLLKKPGMTDDELAKQLSLDVKHVRRLLHQLNDLSLVGYELAFDKEDNRRVFKWRLQPEQVVGVAKNQTKRILERLKMLRENAERSQFYWCGNSTCRKYTFEEALDKLFVCPTCGGKLNFRDLSNLVEAIDRKIEELSKLVS